jgi:ATP-dependent DNA helicase RecG
MIFYADLDVSSIDELPPGRKDVITVVLPSTRRDEVANRIRSVCQSGHQAYWVCPLIDESEKLQAQAATETYASLGLLLPELNVELIHGRLKSKDKESIMMRFADGKIDLLVSTTVIEVGVDVSNASLMIIENAERLGLAQLHQLRGRVGRGADQASCVLMYQSPLGALARERLGILRNTNDGFKIAQKDLEQRGPGELLGTRQTGLQLLRIADLARDKSMLPKIAEIASKLQRHHPTLIQPLVDRWITDSERYANV